MVQPENGVSRVPSAWPSGLRLFSRSTSTTLPLKLLERTVAHPGPLSTQGTLQVCSQSPLIPSQAALVGMSGQGFPGSTVPLAPGPSVIGVPSRFCRKRGRGDLGGSWADQGNGQRVLRRGMGSPVLCENQVSRPLGPPASLPMATCPINQRPLLSDSSLSLQGLGEGQAR